MTRKRRMFDIEMPEDDPVRPSEDSAAPSGGRRSPMASAVRENAESLRARSEAEKAIRAENDALAHEYVTAQKAGLVLRRIPIGEVRTDKLSRDRHDIDPDGLAELKDSIRAIGLSNPIQVEAAESGVELIQGLRRLTAYRALHAETGDETFAHIPAVVLSEGDTIDRLYRRMVDENLVRTDISFAEMAMLARRYADDPATEAADVDAAVGALFSSAGKQKRSYIRAFAQMMAVLEPCLQHPRAIPRALGLAVRKRMESAPESVAVLERQLSDGAGRDAEAELDILRTYAAPPVEKPETGPFPAGNGKTARNKAPRSARTTFQVSSPLGAGRCIASQGRLELSVDTDFSAMDRHRLEEAVARLLKDLSK